MKNIYTSKGKIKKVTLQTYYNLDGDYILFEDNPLHNSTYTNVKVSINRVVKTIAGIQFEMEEVCIEGEIPIECELVGYKKTGDEMIIELCEDWG